MKLYGVKEVSEMRRDCVVVAAATTGSSRIGIHTHVMNP